MSTASLRVIFFGFFLNFCIFVQNDALSAVNDNLSGDDRLRLRAVFLNGIKSNDLQAIYYSALNLRDLTNEDEKSKVCSRLATLNAEAKFDVSKINDD